MRKELVSHQSHRPTVDAAARALSIPLAVAAALVAALFLWAPTDDTGAGMRGDAGAVRPVPVFTPGAVSALDARALCAGERPSRLLTEEVRVQVLTEYGMRDVPADAYELDALITPELGGLAVPANVWPQRYSSTWNAHVKDALESRLAGQVCRGETSLAAAQRALADDWVTAYKRVFNTDVPVAAHLASAEPDDDLIFESAAPVGGNLRLASARTRVDRSLRWAEGPFDRVGFRVILNVSTPVVRPATHL